MSEEQFRAMTEQESALFHDLIGVTEAHHDQLDAGSMMALFASFLGGLCGLYDMNHGPHADSIVRESLAQGREAVHREFLPHA